MMRACKDKTFSLIARASTAKYKGWPSFLGQKMCHRAHRKDEEGRRRGGENNRQVSSVAKASIQEQKRGRLYDIVGGVVASFVRRALSLGSHLKDSPQATVLGVSTCPLFLEMTA